MTEPLDFERYCLVDYDPVAGRLLKLAQTEPFCAKAISEWREGKLKRCDALITLLEVYVAALAALTQKTIELMNAGQMLAGSVNEIVKTAQEAKSEKQVTQRKAGKGLPWQSKARS